MLQVGALCLPDFLGRDRRSTRVRTAVPRNLLHINLSVNQDSRFINQQGYLKWPKWVKAQQGLAYCLDEAQS